MQMFTKLPFHTALGRVFQDFHRPGFIHGRMSDYGGHGAIRRLDEAGEGEPLR